MTVLFLLSSSLSPYSVLCLCLKLKRNGQFDVFYCTAIYGIWCAFTDRRKSFGRKCVSCMKQFSFFTGECGTKQKTELDYRVRIMLYFDRLSFKKGHFIVSDSVVILCHCLSNYGNYFQCIELPIRMHVFATAYPFNRNVRSFGRRPGNSPAFLWITSIE